MYTELLKSAEFYKRRYHNFATVLIIPFVLLVLFIAVFLTFAKKEITVKTTGEVAPTRVVATVQSISDSPVTKNNLKNNQAVHEGDVLLQYQADTDNLQKEAQRKIVDKRDKEKDKKDKEKDDKDKKKSDKKDKEKSDKDSDKDKKDKKKSSDDKEKNDDDINKVTAFAPEDGVISMNPKYESTNLIPQWQEVAQIYPSIEKKRHILITYYVSSDDVSLMKKGKETRFSLEKKGNEKVMIKGKIDQIASAATTTKKGNLFKVTAKVKLSKANSKWIKYGMTGNVVTVVDKKTYFEFYRDKLLNHLSK